MRPGRLTVVDMNKAKERYRPGMEILVFQGEDRKPKKVLVMEVYPHFILASDRRCYQWIDVIRGVL